MTRHRPRAPRLLLGGCSAAAAVLLLSGCGSSPVRAGAAAVVGQDRITTQQFTQQVDQGLADPGASQLAADRVGYQRTLLGRIIDAQVLEQAAKDRGVTVTPGQVDAQYSRLEQANGGPDGLLAAAGAQGYSPAEVRRQARLAALQQALVAKLAPGASPQQANAAITDLARRTADRLHIKVNPRYGTWDPQQLTVVEATPSGNREVSSPAAPAGGPAALPAR